MSLYSLIRPLVFCLEAERAHDWTIGLASRLSRFVSETPPQLDPALATSVAGIAFASPVGLAAGFDKDAKAPALLFRLGFGYLEVGTVTPKPQFGNQRPRVFRLQSELAIINRFGFNSDGHDAVAGRIAGRRGPGILGVNIGANKDSVDKISDYVAGVRRFAACARYITVNVSSPNTPGLRMLQAGDDLQRLIDAVVEARNLAQGPPVFLKIAPDVSDQQIAAIAKASIDGGIDGLVLTNTTVSRPIAAGQGHAEGGGLSGAPLKALSLQVLRSFRTEVGDRLPLIGVGGISSPEDAYERIRAGASLIQLYTGLVYSGPKLLWDIHDALPKLLRRDGFSSIREAVGADERVSRFPTVAGDAPKHGTGGELLRAAG